ncbi:N-acetyltransferase [Filobacillus milosensis]|uniref:N-acetyltransferase n=1 Tax=Filobacillus milosensis TaxID=94137 RepID=A0A4Y8IE87_9BACI|nr:GNAT family N-acetyltransferase [Filobacillus milosensis]TFB14230.1 N-acetyltransferase [Filobacillus milosensis]
MNLTLQTERLILKPFTLNDAPRVVELANDPDLARTTLNIPYPYTIDSAKDWISKHPSQIEEESVYPFAIYNQQDNRLIGTMSIRPNHRHKRGEIAYWIGKDYWGQGFATEAAKRVIKFGSDELLLNKIWAMSLTDNPGSIKVMRKVGMKKEGTLIEHFYKDRKFLDVNVYGMSLR